MLIDTHAHMYLEHFRDDLDDAVARCREHGITSVVLPNIDRDSIGSMSDITRSYPELFFPTLGLHPCSVDANWETELKYMRDMIDKGLKDIPGGRIYGIGETGLDHYWDLTYREEQKAALRVQAAWARELDLPIILHCRESFDDVLAVMQDEQDGSLRGIFHCFSGSKEDAEKILELGGFLMGIGGVLTFKKSTELREAVRDIPIEHLVLETDAPYLSPVPFRGKRNESSYVRFVAETLAEVKGISAEAVAEATSANARALFGLG